MPPSENPNRSIACNGRVLVTKRHERGLTQAQLAFRSGFTERLIRKAEKGQKVAVETLHVLAQTLSEFDEGETVSVADLSTDSVALARQFIHSMYHDPHEVIQRCKHFLAPEIVFSFSGDPDVFPFAGSHAGLQEAEQAFQKFFGIFEPPEEKSEIDGFEYLSTDRGALVWGETWTHPIGQQTLEPIPLTIRMDFSDGLMVRFDDRFNAVPMKKHLSDTAKPE